MKIIFAQGNPGTQYARTRHNVGFMVLDALVQAIGTSWREHTKFRAYIAETAILNEKVLFVKPTTFYNDTGSSARAIIDFYKLDPKEDFLVIHDELALPFGTVRTREKGSDAGNNGIKSLTQHLGAEYARIRIGVWNELRDRMNDADFVLSSFTSIELVQLNTITEEAIMPLLDAFIKGELEATSKRISTTS